MRENRNTGRTSQNNVIKEAGLQDNNNLTGAARAYYTNENLGSTIPDATTSRAWIDIKSINTEAGVLQYSSQLRLQKEATQLKTIAGKPNPHFGKDLVVVMAGKSPIRPTKPLANNATVLKFNETTKEWYRWNSLLGKSGQWEVNPLSLNQVKQLLGS
jgi:hypothetical protein